MWTLVFSLHTSPTRLTHAYLPKQMEEKKWPTIPMSEVSKHRSEDTGIWVTYEDGVYDITNFIKSHPGGMEKIMLAAGGPVDTFWSLYQQHKVNAVFDILRQYRIGTLSADEVVRDLSDPYSDEPARVPALRVHKQKPFNAETPSELIPDNLITPAALWYKRHHHPVPNIDPTEYTLEVASDAGVNSVRNVTYSLGQLKSEFRKHEIVSTMQCAGNRRSELNAVGGKTQGLGWAAGAVSTARWGGVRLRDVLSRSGFRVDGDVCDAEHVWFKGSDPPYDASIPVAKAVDPRGDVLLAYEMNGKPLPRDHGFPIRAIVPGHVAARNVKWVNRVVVSNQEAESGWQRGVQYKGFSANVKSFEGVDPSKVASVQELPVQSAICEPRSGTTVSRDEETVDVRGWAWSGGGRGIVRVDVTTDRGENWITAKLKKIPDQKPGREWAWSHFDAQVPIPEGTRDFEVCARAVDTSYNVQPESTGPSWNLRGILNNAWHCRKVLVDEDD